MTTYNAERRVFDRLRSDCTPEARAEYEQVVATLVERYNTTIYENRFTVGGAVEVFTYALLRSVGIDCTLYGSQSKDGDILLPNDRKLSVKGQFTGSGNVRLMNKQGSGEREWATATLFILSDIGIVFGAPDMVDDEHIRDTSDALEITRRGLRALTEDVDNVFDIAIARKPPTEMTGFSFKASTAVARQILFETKAANLMRAFPD